jgi:integrase/recombinase XerD
MGTRNNRRVVIRRGQTAKPPSRTDLAGAVRETARLWCKHHLGYDQTKYVVEQARRRLGLTPPASRPRTVERPDRAEVERLIAAAYRDGSRRGLMVKTLFLTGARVNEFVHIKVEDLHPDDDPPRVHLAHAKGHADRSVPILPALAQRCARAAGITRRVHPHLLRHSIATILLDSGQVPIDQVRKSLGHLHLSTTQVYAETSLRALGENYVRALSGRS